MTVCIAGICYDGGCKSPAFVVCSDQRIGSDDSGGDVCRKIDHAGGGWLAMFAGTTARARDSIAVYRKRLGDDGKIITQFNIEPELKACARIQKRRLIEELVQTRFGFSYKYVLEHGKNLLPDDVY